MPVPASRKRKSAKRRKSSTVPTVAAQRAGQAFYGIVSLDQVLGPVLLHRPFYRDPTKHDAWDPERKPLSKRGTFIYGSDVAYDIYR